ncbi:hypothetical protein SAMN04488034_1099 [Salinimicrobium catena]|uniref:Phosphoribosyltransferase n=1 Tax=Salinimicrobium catena TaxID=390640 RepID=A0A1H5P5D8_9FLAO|nr:hypothetical protein [Salinimicrobium catena]SDL72426.1 hypothetical protein SAMN04488140_10973 [Salinimicrobium catena]SEF08910.1 hypothetical protein SAMN04488034_1099 [Salinimicrobium catena]
MSLTFTLKDNIGADSGVNRYSVVHKLKNTQLLNNLPEEDESAMRKLWISNRSKVQNEFLKRVKEHFENEEKYGLIVPPTDRKFFTEPLVLSLKESFQNSVDLSDHFSKPEGVSFGTPPYSEMSIEKLREYIEVSEDIPELKGIKRILIVDDVYAQGKTIAVLKLILNEIFGSIDIISGTIIRTRNNY